MAGVQDPGSGLSPQQIAALYQSGESINYIAQREGLSPATVTQMLQQAGYANPQQNLYHNTPTNTPGGETSGAGPVGQDQGPTGPGPGNPPAPDPRGPPPPGFTSWDQYYKYIAQLQASAGGGGGGGSSAAADLAEKKREFDITTQRDIAKENAAEVDALQKMLSGLSGPKDVYADLFFSHGLNVPQGYQPAPVPLTQAQIAAYKNMGVTPQQLQQMIIGSGKPGADTGYLGNLGSSLQPQPGQPGFTAAQAPTGAQQASNPTAQGGQLYGKAPAGTTIAGPAAPQTPAMAGGGEVPGQIGDPRLIVAHGGEQVDNNTAQGPIAPMNNSGVHPAIQKLMDALSELLANPDFQQFAGVAGKAAAISRPSGKGGKGAAKGNKGLKEGSPAEEASETPAQEAAEQAGPGAGPMAAMMPPGPTVTSGGMQAMAVGGSVNPSSGATAGARGTVQPSPVPTGGIGGVQPVGGSVFGAPPGYGGGAAGTGDPHGMPVQIQPASGLPLAGAQGVVSNTGAAAPADNPILPLAKMDPYTRALYDVHGRLHPYSAQQLQQMGPAGQQAVDSYVGKVEGADVNAYTDLAKRLMPIGAAPTASTGTATEGFSFG